MNKKTIILIVVVIALLAGGVWKWKNDTYKKDVARNQTQQQISENPPSPPKNSFDDLFIDIQSADVIIPDTSSWHVYEDTNVGFTTKLPKDWINQVKDELGGCFGTIDNRYGIETEGIGVDCPIQISKYTKPDDEVIKILTEIKDKNKERFFGAIIGEQKLLYKKDEDDQRDYFFKNGNHYWYMIIDGIKSKKNDDLMIIANGMLSEFKSTK